MIKFVTILLILAILSGQLIKIPFGSYGGITLLDIAIACVSILGIKRYKELKKFPSWVISAWVFALISLLSLILTPIHLKKLEFITSFAYILRFSAIIFVGLLAYNLRTLFPKDAILKTLLISGVGLSILGILQLIIFPDLGFLITNGWDPHYLRTVSTFLDPNFLGAYLSLTLILLLQNTKFSKKSKIILFFIIYFALLTTFSRGAFLGFFAGFLFLAILKKSIKFFLLTLLLSLILVLGFIFYQKVIAKPRNIDRTQSAQFRVNSWQEGLTLIQKHPLLGVGFNTYRFALREYNLRPKEFIQDRGASSNDSSLIYVFATTGILGLFSYLVFLFSFIWIGWQNYLSKKPLGTTLLSGLSVIFIQSFFSNTLFYPFLFIWLVLITSKTHDTSYST